MSLWIPIIGRVMMRYCKNCHIHYDTPLEKCMFCNAELDIQGETTFKFAPFKKKGFFGLFYRLFIFFNIISISLSLYVDFNENGFPLTWSILVGLTNLFAIILFVLIFSPGSWISKVNKSVFGGLIWVTGMAYFLGDYHWAIDYVVPISIVFNIALLTVLLIFDRKKWFDYATGLFFFSFIGIIPGIFNIIRLTNVQWPSLISMLYAIVTLIGLLFFSNKEMKDEFKRRFHI